MTTFFKSGSSFFDRSFHLRLFPIRYTVKVNTCYIVSPLILSHCYSEVSRIFTLISNFPVKLFFPETSLRYTISFYIAELYTLLMHCRTMPHTNTLPYYTLSYYFTKLHHFLKPYRTITYLNTLPK